MDGAERGTRSLLCCFQRRPGEWLELLAHDSSVEDGSVHITGGSGPLAQKSTPTSFLWAYSLQALPFGEGERDGDFLSQKVASFPLSSIQGA